jgi:hypothetical protein
MMWLSGVLRERIPNPGQAALQQAFYWLRTTDRWKRHNGADYLFFLSNPNLVNVYDTCAQLTTPYFLVTERGFRCASSPDVLHQLANRTLLVRMTGHRSGCIAMSGCTREFSDVCSWVTSCKLLWLLAAS